MKKSLLCALCSLLFLSACQTSAKLDAMQNNYANGNFSTLTADSDSNNLELLVGAQAEFANNEFKKSDELFETFNHRNISPTGTSIWAESAKLLAGQMATDYKPYMMDYLFVGYYQLWDAIADRRDNDARVIINQSYERQKKMNSAYHSLISSKQKQSLPDGVITDTSYWNAYSEIMNPALMYLSGLFYLNTDEYEMARQYFSRASGMLPENKIIKSDLKSANELKSPNNVAWVFTEVGFAPRLVERRVDIPWPVGNQIQVISLATTGVKTGDGQWTMGNANLLADVDAMFMTEYKYYQVNDALRALAKTASNIALQSAAGNNGGDWGALFASIYTIATTSAEIRSWVTLPQRIYIQRIQKDKSGLIKLNSGDTLDVEYNGNHLIYIRGTDVKKIRIK